MNLGDAVVSGKEVTFVIQGKVKVVNQQNITADVLKSVRTNFPESKIILSTDYDTDVSGLDFDEVVFSKPPFDALIENERSMHMMSVNHQIVSSIKGLRHVHTKYAVKSRTDVLFTNDNLLKLLDKKLFRESTPYNITEIPVIVLNWSTVHPRKSLPLVHHVSDHFYAGLTKDIVKIWDTPIYPQVYMQWYKSHDYPIGARHGGNLQLYRAEQWIWFNFVQGKTNFAFENAYMATKESITESLLLMCNNVIVVTDKILGVVENKFSKRKWRTYIKMMNHYEWVYWARKSGIKAFPLGIDLKGLALRITWELFRLLRIDWMVFYR